MAFYHAEFNLTHGELDLPVAELGARLIPLLKECRLWDVTADRKIKIIVETLVTDRRVRITVEPILDEPVSGASTSGTSVEPQ